jgi:hypothetical protein
MLNVDAREKLKGLVPPGVVVTKKWLLNQGFNPHFVDNAVRSKTLLPLVNGVFCQFSKQLNWKGVVASLQRMSDEPVHLGGLSALELVGFAHYVSRAGQIHLYSARPLPRWLSRLELGAEFVGHSTRTLWPDELMNDVDYVKKEDWREGLPPLIFSCAEKAMLEVLADVPKKITFEHADQLMQSLQNLSPKRLDALLQVCINIKVKRLFFWLAKRHQFSWLKKLDAARYDFGSGKRLIEMEGRFDSKWLITVPKNM